MADFMLDTSTASKLMRAERSSITAMRRASAQSVTVSAITYSELLYGAHLSGDSGRMAKVRRFVSRIAIRDWDALAAETHAQLRAATQTSGRSAGIYDLMIAAHAVSLGQVLVTSDKAIANLGIDGLRIVEW